MIEIKHNLKKFLVIRESGLFDKKEFFWDFKSDLQIYHTGRKICFQYYGNPLIYELDSSVCTSTCSIRIRNKDGGISYAHIDSIVLAIKKL